jgi:acetate kinase
VRILVVNAGSTSVKLRLLDGDDALLDGVDLGAPDAPGVAGELHDALAAMPAPDAVGHRVVHGGETYREAVRLDARVIDDLRALTALAPLHQPKSLLGIEAVARALPGVPEVACFDTAFHATLPPAARTYALPREWRERWPLRRYGFHGLSHAYVARRVASMTGRDDLRVVSCHLGAGASLAAIVGGRCVDTTMGFTPLEGLVMATRSGSVDPGLVLWLVERLGDAEVTDALEHRAGLAGLAGTSDMRDVLAHAARGDEDAVLAVDVYVHRLRALVAAMTAALEGLDALVFTGGVGEHAPEIRARTAAGLAFLGVAVDPARRTGADADFDIGPPEATVRTLVVAAREDLEVARQVRAVLHGGRRD